MWVKMWSTLVSPQYGPDAATGVVLTDTIPAGMTFVSATNGGTESGGVITWNIGNLAVDGEFTALVTARVNAGTQGQTLTNTVSAVNTQNPTPVTDTSDIYVNSAPLTITKTTDKAQYNVGDTVTYTINVTNIRSNSFWKCYWCSGNRHSTSGPDFRQRQ